MLQFLKIKNIVISVLMIIILSGCEASYTITINKDTINEKIEVLDNVSSTRTVTDVMDNYKKNYPVYDTDNGVIDWETLYNTEPDMVYYGKTYDIDSNGYHLYYEYTHSLDDYALANSINYSYDHKNIKHDGNNYSISIGAPNNRLKYMDIFTNLTVNIITDYVVLNNNADSVIGNRYIWYINKNNNDSKKINFEVDLSKKQSEIEKEENIQNTKSKIMIPVVIGALLIYIIFIIYMLTKKRNNKGA